MNPFLAFLLTILVLAAPQDDVYDSSSEFVVRDAEANTTDLDDMMARRTVRVLTTYNKSNFFIAGGRLRGFEYELLMEFEKFLNKDVSRRDIKTTLVFAPVPKDRLIPLLLEGKGDIAGNLFE